MAPTTPCHLSIPHHLCGRKDCALRNGVIAAGESWQVMGEEDVTTPHAPHPHLENLISAGAIDTRRGHLGHTSETWPA